MKKHMAFATVFIVLSLFHISCGRSSKTPSHIVSPELPVEVEEWEDLFQAGRYYFGGQPDEEMLGWLRDEEVEVVINLRTNEEMESHSKEHFSEDSLVADLGMTYLHFPMGGKAGYSTAVVDTFAQALNTYKGKTFIHCKVGGRVSYLWVAYLISHRGIEINKAIEVGKKMKFRFVLEDLLGYPLSMRKKE